jgi:hypothetical protein
LPGASVFAPPCFHARARAIFGLAVCAVFRCVLALYPVENRPESAITSGVAPIGKNRKITVSSNI